MLPSLSVFFPCYNEEKNVRELVLTAHQFLPTIAKKFEIIIVNDGSSDRTAKIAQELIGEYPNIRLVSHTVNLGYGAALKTGIANARYEWTFWSDGDLQFDIKTLQSFMPYVEDYSAIIGYRAHRADTFIRKVNGELYTMLINILFRLGVKDIDCAFKLIKTELLQSISIESSSAFTSSEILIRLKRKRIRFKQIPVSHFPRKRGNPTGGNIKVIFKGLRQTLAFYFRTL